MSSIALEYANQWQEVAPCADAPSLLVECEGQLGHIGSDGSLIRDFGLVGPVDCPLAYDSESRTAYRYVCGADLSRRDFSQLNAYALDRGSVETLCELPLNQWALWLLTWIRGDDGRGGQLFGLMASDLPIEGQVCLQHRLFALDPERPLPRFRALCRDAYKPLAFSKRRRQLIFSGAEGTYLIGLNGERVRTLASEQRPPADSASFDPSGAGRVALSSEGPTLWDLESGRSQQLTKRGRQPVWSPQGDSIWYADSSGALHRYDLIDQRSERVLSIKANRFPDFWKSRLVCISPCGRYLAAMLLARKLVGVTRKSGGIDKNEKVYQDENCFCVLDLEAQSFWRVEGPFNSVFRWV